ncbi:MAG: GNAT family N-acetyltransferase [Candidatus Bathyarchaeia archaeon]
MPIVVREMKPDEKEGVEELFRRSLCITDRLIFQLSFEDSLKSARRSCGGTLVAEWEDKIVGALSMRIQSIKGEKIGYIDALVSDKEFRGRRIGRSLVDEALSWLMDRGCEVIYATADRYNSPSWNLFIHRGFYPYEAPQHLRDYGFEFLRLWLGEYYFIAFGAFFLRKDIGKEKKALGETKERWHWLAALLGVSGVWWTQLFRSQGSLMLFPAFLVATAISLLIHELPQSFAAKRLGLETTFKAWSSGLIFSTFLGFLGLFFPAYGSTYIKRLDWWYDPKKDGTGIVFALGPISSLMLSFLLLTISSMTKEKLLVASATVGYVTSLSIAILNLIPIKAAGGFVWDGKKILDWNKGLWGILVTAAIALVLIDVFL